MERQLQARINDTLAFQFQALPEPKRGVSFVGLLPDSVPLTSYFNRFKHTLATTMLTILMTEVQRLGIELSAVDILEVGGGYGYLPYLLTAFCDQFSVPLFRSYTIFDMSYMSQLQGWYLAGVLPERVAVAMLAEIGESAGEVIPPATVNLVGTESRNWYMRHWRILPDGTRDRTPVVALACDSLNELSLDEFAWYMWALSEGPMRAEVLIYSHGDAISDKADNQQKLAMLSASFRSVGVAQGLEGYSRQLSIWRRCDGAHTC
mmetsp:Transcript_36898/g.82967  ORF Transcript_36898/g.82967 Transcript_36898/m.82967 type:complete len:263 (-) Transcript_36898:591-1379(-)